MEEKIYFINAFQVTSKNDGKTYCIMKYLTENKDYFSVIISNSLYERIIEEEYELFEELTITYALSKKKKAYICDITR